MRFRNVYMGVGSLLVLIVMFLVDPDNLVKLKLPIGPGTVTFLVTLARSILFVGALHFGLRAMFDYIDKKKFFSRTENDPIGSGLALVSLGLFAIAIALLIFASVMAGM